MTGPDDQVGALVPEGPPPSEEEDVPVGFRRPKWLDLVTGARVDETTIAIPAKPVSVGHFLTARRALLTERHAQDLRRAAIDEELRSLETLALSRRDLRRALQEEEARAAPPVARERPVEEQIRCKTLRKFSLDYGGLYYLGLPGDVRDLPAGLVKQLGPAVESAAADEEMYIVPREPWR